MRNILRLFVAMLFSALGASMAFATPINTSESSFYQAENTLLTQSQDVGFAVRAPPLSVANVAVTGGITSMQGSAFALHGQETVAALFGFDGSSIATNRTVPNGSAYSQADYDAYVQRKLDAGETPRSPEDYVQRRQQLDQNRADGARRQEEYRQEMADIYGEENVLTERYLRDADGSIVRDPDTGEARRLDCVVVNGQCGYAAEVTSPTADKDFQITKEENIREAGGIYVENPRTGELIEVENTSEVIRLE